MSLEQQQAARSNVGSASAAIGLGGAGGWRIGHTSAWVTRFIVHSAGTDQLLRYPRFQKQRDQFNRSEHPQHSKNART